MVLLIAGSLDSHVLLFDGEAVGGHVLDYFRPSVNGRSAPANLVREEIKGLNRGKSADVGGQPVQSRSTANQFVG